MDIFFGVITKLDYVKGSFLCFLGSFHKVKVQNEGYFLGLLKFQIFFGCLKFLIFLGSEGLMLGPSLRMKKKMREPPWGPSFRAGMVEGIQTSIAKKTYIFVTTGDGVQIPAPTPLWNRAWS